MSAQDVAEVLKAMAAKGDPTEHLAKPIASIYVSKEGRSMDIHLDTSKATYGDWIEGEGADICLHRDMETKRLAGADLPCYAKTLMIGGDFPMITIDLLSGMANFVRKLQSGEPIEVATLRREETPDGPLHTREKRILGEHESSSNP